MKTSGMSLIRSLSGILRDPPPAFAFELSEAGVAAARVSRTPELDFRPLPPGAISVSPVRDNVVQPDEIVLALRSMTPPDAKRRTAALILPDYSARIAVIDFDDFPSDAREQLSLIKFRMRKSVPYDIESAALSFWPQPGGGKGKLDVLVAVAPLETVARFEAPFRMTGFTPGLVTISALCALRLLTPDGVTVMAKLSGHALTIFVTDHSRVKLVRCLEAPSASLEDLAADLYPTFIFVEDTLGMKASRLVLSGFGGNFHAARERFSRDLELNVEPLASPFGPPAENNTGLLGYLTQ
jgi:type IV pilus assembly protein PilM